MKKLLATTLLLIITLVVVPPLWYGLRPVSAPTLPAPQTEVRLPSGTVLNTLDSGSDGPPIVLVHGLPGSAYDWRELVPRLAAAGHRVIAVDRAGYGHSSRRASDDYTLRSNTRDLLELLETLDLRAATIVGWSYGGVMAMDAAAMDPSRLGRIVLVASGGPSSDDDRPPEAGAALRFFYSEPVLRWRASIPPLSRGLMEVLSDQAFSGGAQADWWLPSLVANFSRWETTLTYRDELLAPIEILLDLDAVRVPTLVLHGDDDRLAPVSIGRYLASRIPDATYEEVPRGSHMLPVTHAGVLAARILAFAGADDA